MRRILLALFAVLAMTFGVMASASAQDVDCDEVSYARAQEILAQDPSDPYDLDRDGDGEACDSNAGDGSTSGGGGGGDDNDDTDNGDDNGDDNDTTTLPETGTGTTGAAGSAASLFGAVAGMLLIVAAAVRRTSIFRA